MKKIIIALAVILAIIFIFSLKNTYQSYIKLDNTEPQVSMDTIIHSFDPALNTVPGFTEIEKRMSGMIKGYKQTQHTASLWNIILNLLVTILSGLTVLIASISTIKNNSISKSDGIKIAIITFVAALLSFGQSQITVTKEAAQKDKEDVITIRDEMEALNVIELQKQLPIFNRRLDEEFN